MANCQNNCQNNCQASRPYASQGHFPGAAPNHFQASVPGSCPNGCQSNVRFSRRPTPSRTTDNARCSSSDTLPQPGLFPAGAVVAMAYVPWQKWQNIYDACKGLERGTIFADLDKPFMWKGGCCR